MSCVYVYFLILSKLDIIIFIIFQHAVVCRIRLQSSFLQSSFINRMFYYDIYMHAIRCDDVPIV